MPKYFVFASNVRDFKVAANAKLDSGPLETNFSTDSIVIDHCHATQDDAHHLLFLFPHHEAFRAKTTSFHVYDEFGNEVG